MSFLDNEEFSFNFEIPNEPITKKFVDEKQKEYQEYMEKITHEKDKLFAERGLPWLRATFLNGIVSHQILIWHLLKTFPEKQEELENCLKMMIMIQALLFGGMIQADWHAHKEKTKEEELRLLEHIMTIKPEE